MYFITLDLSFWYDVKLNGNIDLEAYIKWVNLVKTLGFDCVVVDENLFPFVNDILKDSGLDILFSPSCTSNLIKKEDGSYHLEYWRDEEISLSDEIENYTLEKLEECLDFSSKWTTYFQDKNKVIYLNHLGIYREPTFVIKSRKDILEGGILENHDKMIRYFCKTSNIVKGFGFKRHFFPMQIQGFGANQKSRQELDAFEICKEATKIVNPFDFYYYTPTQMAHDSKYLATNIILQNSLKRNFGIKLGWGAMGILGFPITSSVAHLNGVDAILMITNELTYGKNRLTFKGYKDVSESKIFLIKDTIEILKNNDDESTKRIIRKYSRQATKTPEFGKGISDEHFSFDGII